MKENELTGNILIIHKNIEKWFVEDIFMWIIIF